MGPGASAPFRGVIYLYYEQQGQRMRVGRSTPQGRQAPGFLGAMAALMRVGLGLMGLLALVAGMLGGIRRLMGSASGR